MTRRRPHPLVASLRDERVRRGLTQAAVARRAGYTRRTIGCYEIGHHVPSVDALIRWAHALDYTLTLTPTPVEGGPEPISAARAASNRRELARALGITNDITANGQEGA